MWPVEDQYLAAGEMQLVGITMLKGLDTAPEVHLEQAQLDGSEATT
jgi:hypothetical protein